VTTMTLNKPLAAIIASGLFLEAAAGAAAQEPDHTKVNNRDRTSAQPNAGQARNNRSDREIMQSIRKAVIADRSLSTYGHNSKIIAQHGKVTLTGPDRSEEESRNIEAKAIEVAGAGNVTNRLSISGEK
jgi:hyperosmotically inducible protein